MKNAPPIGGAFKQLLTKEHVSVNNNHKQEKSDCNKFGPSRQKGVNGTSLIFRKERIRSACNYTNILLMTFLHQNDYRNADRKNHENDSKYNLTDSHILPPKLQAIPI
jgi:hypothetical protein